MFMSRLVGTLALPFLLVLAARGQFTNVNVGATANDGTGDTARLAFQKLNYADDWLKTNLVSLSNTVSGLSLGSAVSKMDTNNGTSWGQTLFGPITNANNTANRVLILDSAKRQTNSAVTDVELGYLGGVTSAVQSQLGGKLSIASNLLDVASIAAARSNLVVETKRTFNVLDYIVGSPGTNAANDTLGIRAARDAAGTNSILTFPAGKTFLTAGALEPLTDQTWMAYGAIIKRANETKVTFATPITTLAGNHTITVASTNGFFVGMDVSVFNGASFDASRHRILSMTATTITIGTDFTTAFASGGTLVTAFAQIEAVNVPRVRILGGEFDGNQANNASLQKWQLNVEIYLSSDGGVIRDTYIHDAQSEGIELAGVNVLVDHVRIENCQGNGIHLFATEHPVIRSSKVKNCNLSGTATGHADGCVIASNVVGDWIVENCWLENGISGVGSFDSTDNSRLLVHGCTFTNFTQYAIEANLPDGTDVSDAIVTDNKFFNAAVVSFVNNGSDSTSASGPKSIIFAKNLLEDTRTIFTLTRGVTFSGNTLSNSTTTQIHVQLTDCRDFLASGNQLNGGGYGFYMQSANLPTASTNNINIAINGNLLRNQFNASIRFQTPQAINCSAKNNTIIAQTGLVSASWDGILVKEDCTVEGNQIYAEAGLNGINMAPARRADMRVRSVTRSSCKAA
jgi:hypothetical protein